MSSRARGMSLIEVLVSLVILSLGVLAVVALQLVAKRNNADAGQRTIAAQLAYDIIERMRANSFAAALDAYRTSNTDPIGEVGGLRAAPSGNTCDGAGSTCDSAQLVAYDLFQWEQALLGAAEQVAGSSTGGLTFPTGCIDGPTGGGDGVYTISIAWRGSIELPNNPSTDVGMTCGNDATIGGTKVYGDQNQYRRVLRVQAYITARRST